VDVIDLAMQEATDGRFVDECGCYLRVPGDGGGTQPAVADTLVPQSLLGSGGTLSSSVIASGGEQG